MSCIISAPSTDSGKTTLALLISCWASAKGLKIQTFKIGPDYLDQQQLSSIGHPQCRNLDIFLSGEEWIRKTFIKYSNQHDLSLIEGAMGLFDGLGSSQYASTANVAKVLNLPIIFIIDARGQVGSLLATLNGFRDLDKSISIKGVVFNNVNSDRHKNLIIEVFEDQNIEILGFLPTAKEVLLKKGNLGIISPLESRKEIDIKYFANFAEKHLNFSSIKRYLITLKSKVKPNIENPLQIKINKPVAIAEDKIFHFQYPETKDFLREIGVPLISWDIFNDKEIPSDASSVIIPGGFPEKYADHLSSSKRSLNSLKSFLKTGFIYAECGGMMILGESIEDKNGKEHKMANILPFKAKKGKLSVGYRDIKGTRNSLIIQKDQALKGHEFHYWQIEKKNTPLKYTKKKINNPWKIKSWGTSYENEGWCTNNLHASWVHLHLPSSLEGSINFINCIEKFSNKNI